MRRREAQLRRAIWSTVEDRLIDALRAHPDVQALAPRLEADVVAGKLPPTLAAERLLAAFGTS
jgi:LAO/AO transport system kinase